MFAITTSRSHGVAKQGGGLSRPPRFMASAMDLKSSAGEAAALLKALANPDRLLLLCQLVGGERSVGEMGASAGIEQPSLSQQLGVLRGEGLVATRREGRQVVYRIASPAALAMLDVLHTLFCDPELPTTAVKSGRASRRAPGRSIRKLP